MTTYHKINSASKDELKQIATQTAELNQKMYAMLSFLLTELKGAEEIIAWDDVEKLLAEARGEL